jgi:phosphoheptose isomerase
MSVLFYDAGQSPASVIQDAMQILEIRGSHPHLVLWAGNGGCAAMADHMAAELMTGFGSTARRIPSVSLACNTALLTAITNDFGAEKLFSQQIDTLATPADLVILLSTSGESPNLLEAAKSAKSKAVRLLSIVGQRTSLRPALTELSDASIMINQGLVSAIQEDMLRLTHAICAVLLQSDAV